MASIKFYRKKSILILVGAYLPGYRAGGPIRTISNLIDHLGEEFDFKIITADRDLGDSHTYATVSLNSWNQQGKAQVFYISASITLNDLAKLINSIEYDLIYINSFFNLTFSIKPLILRKLGRIKNAPVVLAPRGEFSENALNIKKWKKTIFILIARFFGLYKNIVWQASTEIEKTDIQAQLKKHVDVEMDNHDIVVCRDLAQPYKVLNTPKLDSEDNILKICFLSRLAPMKNLDYALQILKLVKVPVKFNIYGPKESLEYWEVCEKLIQNLPKNIHVEVHGPVPNHEVRGIISQHDIFFVPTQGENFGHAFIEAFSAGVPVLVSDRTPWRNLAEQNIGWDFPLDANYRFVEAIENFSKMKTSEKLLMRESCQIYARKVVNDESTLDANKSLFLNLIKN